MLSFLTNDTITLVGRSVVTVAFLWTLLNGYIIFNVDSNTRWARYSVKGYIFCWCFFGVVSVLGVIWTS